MLQYLPNEVILMVFQNLELKDLINVTEVCKTFYQLGTDPTLWENYDDISSKSLSEMMVLLSLPRFKNLRLIEFSGRNNEGFYSPNNFNKLLRAIMNTNIASLCFSNFFLPRDIDKDLLAELISNTSEVIISPESNNDFGKAQLRKIMEKIPGGEIKHLHLNNIHLNIDPHLVAKAVNSLEIFDYVYCSHHPSVIKEIFIEMSKSSKLKDLTFAFRKNIFIDHIQPEIFVRALSNLESLRFDNEINFSLEALKLLFYKISEGQTKLQKLVLLGPDTIDLFRCIPSSILGKAINNLETFMAPRLIFTTDQLESILSGMKLESSKLKKIDLGKGKLSTDTVGLANIKEVLSKLDKKDLRMFAKLFNLGTLVFFGEEVVQVQVNA